jgi:hypothetical protein
MKLKGLQRYFFQNSTRSGRRSYGSMASQYSGMLNLASAYQRQVDSLVQHLTDVDNTALIQTIHKRLNYLWTHHSLRLTGQYSLSLEETLFLLQDQRTNEGRNFYEQLKAMNHQTAIDYSRQYISDIIASRDQKSKRIEVSDHHILTGLGNIDQTFVSILQAGHGGTYDVMYGQYHPAGTFYFYDRNDEHVHLTKGRDLLHQSLTECPQDIFMIAAQIHGEFAKAHHSDKDFGLVFCRLYTNMALMSAGHVPVIIEASQKEEYLGVVKHQLEQQDPEPMAKFLVRCLNHTYTTLVLPKLEAGATKAGIKVPFTFGHH